MRAAYFDPQGRRHGIPTWPFGMAPDGLFTRSQLRQMGLRPTGDPVAQLMWDAPSGRRPPGGGARTAALYRLSDTLLRDPVSPARLAQLAGARAARRICPSCRRDVGYVPPAHLGERLDCHDGAGRATAA